ncbi:hypothetical protein SAMN05216517_10992 [Janthinobacterium sp. OK676]|uniref:S24 family peptidase n=1 Tax=Janthinobacterium sp. OK676 TaxID=1855295 RepID=UPI00088C9C79|nr:S24 family peptidase [Janthinobacterium sp. OK676]SDN24590.1 hypothetical protein SAMN05216517_10992 [Janthinobacterium sp. OK676]
MVTISNNIPLTKDAVRELDVDIVPGVRQRLIAELDRREVLPNQREHFLSDITGRALQTVARWIDEEKPGLPDLKSLAIVCLQLDMDANWILGLTSHRIPFPRQQLTPGVRQQVYGQAVPPFDWIGHLLAKAASLNDTDLAGLMRGDDMAPLIQEGSLYFFDACVHEIDINGIYVLEYQEKVFVRHVEIVVGDGLLLRCENPRYKPTMVKMAKVASTLKIVGRVKNVLNFSTL